MIEKKPYLIRAIYNWAIDNELTPHLLIDKPDKNWLSGVPPQLCRDKLLVLNISPQATRNCVIGDDVINFTTRFQGISCQVSVEIDAITGICARENGDGMYFDAVDYEARTKNKNDLNSKTKNAPTLKILK